MRKNKICNIIYRHFYGWICGCLWTAGCFPPSSIYTILILSNITSSICLEEHFCHLLHVCG